MALTDNLVAYYKFDENTGSTAWDSVGSNDGTITWATWTTWKINDWLEFTWEDTDRVDIGSWVMPTWNNERTINMWINPDGMAVAQERIFWSWTLSNGTWFDRTAELLGPTPYILFRHQWGNIRFPWISDWSWQMVTIVVPSGATMTSDVKLYIDWVEATGTRNAGSDQTLNTWVSDVYIGNSPEYPSDSFDGKIDEVGIWSRALSSSEITELYNGGAWLQYPFTTTQWNFFMVM